ncbi:MAG: enoyl-[acyl-carrier protein] reductase/trans-2-enoyl-CoA reductase (NAD+), partial [Maribacter sp.]
VAELWQQATTETLPELGDLQGYTTEFFNLFGFKVDTVDYTKEANEMTTIPSIEH